MRPYGIPLDVFATFRQTWYKVPAPERENAARWISGPCFIRPCFSGWEASTGGVSSVIARAASPKQSHGNQKGLNRAVYPEDSRRVRNDTGGDAKNPGRRLPEAWVTQAANQCAWGGRQVGLRRPLPKGLRLRRRSAPAPLFGLGLWCYAGSIGLWA